MADKQTTFSAPVKNSLFSVTCCAPVNIAVIKYWGKRDEKLILPINGSVSATLCENELQAKTTAAASKEFKSDRMWLNGKERNMDSERLQNVLREIKRRVRKRKSGDSNASDLLNYHVHICSENNFPTAAGLASSAAGYACLVYTLAKLFGVSGDITEIARQGSGSACRSLHGGFVEWVMGDKEDGSDSLGRQVVDHTHWPEMRILILVVSDQKKQVGSTSGMQTSVLTSHLLNYRARHVVPDRITKMNEAIRARDFTTFAEITMKDSNQLHATCLDTYPPVFYMNDTSRKIIQFVHGFNSYCGETKVAYTFDAGPNACLYLLEKDVPTVLALVQHYFKPPSTNGGQFLRGMTSDIQQPEQNLLKAISLEQTEGVKYIIHTKVGAGPRQLEDSESLLGDNGLPKSSSSL